MNNAQLREYNKCVMIITGEFVPLFVKMMCIETEDLWTYVPNRPATNFD